MRDAELELELEDMIAEIATNDLESEAEIFGSPAPDMRGQSRLHRDQSVIGYHLAQGVLDENQLTDAVFFDRHPERRGTRLSRNEWALRQEWIEIRDALVRPLLRHRPTGQQAGQPASRIGTSGTGAGSTAAKNVSANDIRSAQSMAARAVPGMPGVTIAQLIDQYRPTIAPEIPLPVLLAFIYYESGGHFNDATHGSARNPIPYTSPPFYELGLFQTPAGAHGGCTTGEHESCAHPPPGIENARDPSPWARYCKLIRANPGQWRNPVTQVRVGLLDLQTSAEVIRNRNRDLFSAPGNDWDLRAAVLLPFAGGGGYTQGFLSRYRAGLARLPEDRRWDLLRGKIRVDLASNVDKKMSLAGSLGYQP